MKIISIFHSPLSPPGPLSLCDIIPSLAEHQLSNLIYWESSGPRDLIPQIRELDEVIGNIQPTPRGVWHNERGEYLL